MINSVVLSLSLLLAALTGAVTSQGINPVQHSEGRPAQGTATANYTPAKPPNPVQHSE